MKELNVADIERGFSLKDFPQEQRATAHVIIALRQSWGPDLALARIRWGLPILKDMATVQLHADMSKAGLGVAAVAGARAILTATDWDAVDSLFAKAELDYLEFCRKTGELEKVRPAADALEYGMKGKMPGVEVPGDLFAQIMGTPATS